MNSALSSLTEAYTDSENEDRDEPEDVEMEVSEPDSKQSTPTKKAKAFRLVSYNDNELPEGASDDDEHPADETIVSEEMIAQVDPDDKFAQLSKKFGFQLPPESKSKTDAKLQERITSLHDRITEKDFDLAGYIQEEKKFRNPSIYDKLIQFCSINELGTNFPAEIFDLSIYGPESYYEELAKAQKTEMDKLEKQKKEANKNEQLAVAKKIVEETTKRKSKWDQQPAMTGASSATQSITIQKTTTTTVINAFGTLKKPKV
jgi:hypothetical protein